jgi:spore maturation protein SpmB
VAVYEEFIEGAKEGIQVALRIFPYLVGMRRERQALAAGLLADAAGVAASLVICRLNFK